MMCGHSREAAEELAQKLLDEMDLNKDGKLSKVN